MLACPNTAALLATTIAQEEEDFDGGMVKATVVLLASKAQLGLLLPLQLLQ